MRTPRAPAISLSKALALPAPAASQITPPRASFSLLARNVAQPGAPRPCSTPRASQSVTARSTAAAAQPLSLVRRGYSTSSKSIKDAEHPTGLWYHPLSGSSDTTRYAVSFLSQAPKSQDAKDVIAVLSVPAAKASDPAAFARQNPDKAVANRAFWDLLHTTLKEDVVQGEKDAILTQEADLREDGWAHLADQRQLLMPGRIPTPDAIIASVSFANCKIAPDTYTINDTHRPITKEEGWTVLRDEWLAALKARLKREA